MNAAMLYDAISDIDDDILIDVEQFICQQNKQGGLDHNMKVIPVNAWHNISRWVSRAVAAVLVAVLLLVSATGVAMAINPEFRAYVLKFIFASQSEEALTPNQNQFIDENSVGIGESVTADGYTVTVDSAICDAYNLYLVIKVEGPEGVKLDLSSEGGNLFFGHIECKSTGTYARTGYILGWGSSWRILDDGDGRQNTATLVMKEFYVMSADNDGIYTDGEMWRLQLADLTVQAGEMTMQAGEYSYEQTILAEGGWSFEFPLTKTSEKVELISSPVVCLCQAGGENGPKESKELIVDSLVLTPLGAICRYSFIPGNRPDAVDPLDVYLVMKDGSVIQARIKAGGGAGALGSNGGEMYYTFDAPIVLNDVAYLRLPEDIQIPFPNSVKRVKS